MGATAWGSMRLLASAPEAVAAPPVPNAISPVGDVTVPGAAVALTFSRVTDAAGADITYDVEVYLGDVAGAPLVVLAVPQAATSPVVATVAATLEAGVYSWRVRARSTNGNSAWSPVARFHVEETAPVGGSSSGGSASSEGGTQPGGDWSASSGGTAGGGSRPVEPAPEQGPGAEPADEGDVQLGCSSSTPGAWLSWLAVLLVFRRRTIR